MAAKVYVGVAAGDHTLVVVAREAGKPHVALTFPSNVTGIESLQLYLSNFGMPIRLAVAGAAALGTALSLCKAPIREIFIVSSSRINQAADLVRYAEYAI